MERKRTIQLGNESVEAIEMPYQVGGEHWNEYVLNDGSVIRIKWVVTEMLKVSGKFDNEGNPLYIVRSKNVVSVSASDRAKKQTSEE
jgi:hypothetical protein